MKNNKGSLATLDQCYSTDCCEVSLINFVAVTRYPINNVHVTFDLEIGSHINFLPK